MAVNHLFAFSASVEGAGVAAGSPYGCGVQPDEEDRCYYGHVDIPASVGYAYQRYQEGHIDDLGNLKKTPVLLFNGNSDNEVYTRTMVDTFNQLQYFVDAKFLHTAFTTDAAHVWSVDHGKCDCGACADFDDAPLCCDVNNCFYDLSGDMLRKIYGPLRDRVQVQPVLHRINQWKYVPPWEWDVNTTSNSTKLRPARNASVEAPNKHGMWRWALAYVPSGCVGKVGPTSWPVI
ncbi:unnamed protein product [Symbiodinium natans]|uniref:Uncharacterized protein n=1 Tax=Symbiodinium natans TaxID=878477 RepID=A0A812M723_9DINO|nr:unnamed protein product [Symbiodinium natans]